MIVVVAASNIPSERKIAFCQSNMINSYKSTLYNGYCGLVFYVGIFGINYPFCETNSHNCKLNFMIF